MQLVQNLFSFQTPFKFLKSITGSGEITSGARDHVPLCFERKTQKRGDNCLVMIDNQGNYLEQLRIMLPRLMSF